MVCWMMKHRKGGIIVARNKFNIDEELDTPFNWLQFKRALVYIKNYKKNIALMFLLSCVTIVLGLLMPKIQQNVIDKMIPAGRIGWIIGLGVAYFCVNILTILINRYRSKISVRTGQSIITDIRSDVFIHLQKLSFDYYDSRPHGKILTRVINYVNSVGDFLTNAVINVILEFLSMIFILFFMIGISPKMTLVVLAGLPFFALYVIITKPAQRRFRQKRANKQSNTTAYLSENINGAKVTQAFSREAQNKKTFDGLLEETRKYTLRAVYLGHGMWPMSMLIARLIRVCIYLAAVFWFKEDFIVDGVFQLGATTAMIAYADRFWGPHFPASG